MPFALGIDLSTQSCSGLVIDTSGGRIAAQVSINFGEHLPQYKAPSGFIPNMPDGQVHSDPRMWLDGLELMLEKLAADFDLSQIKAISGAGQQHGSIYLNDRWLETIGKLDGAQTLAAQLGKTFSRSTSPIWMDSSTSAECMEIAEAVGGNATVCEKTGSNTAERFTGPQIRRFYKEQPDAYQQTTRIHLVSSFICSLLSGKDAPIDTGDGAGMNLMDIHKHEWEQTMLNATAPDLRKRLPAVVSGGTIVGTLSDYFVQKYGFAKTAQVLVCTGDNPSSLVGMGVAQQGSVVISLGTSDTLFAAMPNIVTDPNGSGHVFGNPLGGVMALQCFANGSLAREKVRDYFGLDWQQFSDSLTATPQGNNGLYMIPFFTPEISPRISLEKPIFSQGDDFPHAEAAVRACIEGQFVNMKLQTEWMGLTPERIYLTGGASSNDAIAQVVADVFGVPILRSQTSDSVGLGAAMRAAHHCLVVDITQMEDTFCLPDDESALQPQVDAATTYAPHKAFLCDHFGKA